MIDTIRQGLQEEGYRVSFSQLCRWFGFSRRSWYYRAVKSAPRVKPGLEAPIKALIEEEPSFGYRTVAHLLGMNKNTVQHIFQLILPTNSGHLVKTVHWEEVIYDKASSFDEEDPQSLLSRVQG